MPHHGTRVRGRDSQIAAALAVLRGSTARSVLIVGEAGSGKTALLGQLLHDLGPGAEVLTVRGSAAISGSDYASLGLLLSELPESSVGHPFAVADGLARLLAERAHGRPVVVGVDNAEAVDPRSAIVLGELCARGAVRLVLCTSDADQLHPGFEHLVYSDGVLRIELPPLSLPDAALVLADDLGGMLSRMAAFTIWEAAAGNPRYLGMMRMSLLADDRLVLEDGIWVLRDGGPRERDRRLALERLHGMRAEHRRILDILACVRELPLPLLLDIAGHEALDELMTLRLILVDQRRAPAVRLRHPGLGDVIRAELPLLRRRALHDDVLAVIGDRPVPAATRAGLIEWAVDARERVPVADVLAAAEFALQSLEPARAAHLVASFPRSTDDVHALVTTLEVFCASGQYHRAARELEDWRRHGFALTDAEFVDLAIAEQGVYRNLPDGYARAGDVLIAARGRADGDVGLLARIETAEVELAAHQGHFADIIATHLPDGLDALMPRPGSVLTPDCVTRTGWIAESLAHVGRTDDALRLIAGVRLALPPDGVSPLAGFAFTEHEFLIRILSGDFATCRALVAAGMDDTGRPPGPIVLNGELWEGLVDSLTGHHDRALASLRPAIAQLAVDGRAPVLPLALATAAYNSARLGHTEEAAAFLGRLDAYASNAAWVVRRYAEYFRNATRLLLDEDRPAAVAALLAESRADEERGLRQMAFDLALTAAITGDAEAARTAGRLAETVQGPVAALARRLAAGIATGDPEQLLAAGTAAERLELDAVVVAVADRMLATEPLTPAHRRAARGLLQRTQQRTATPAVATRRLETLTPMERDVADAVANGTTNEELGRRLHLSRRTVEWHLANIYEKLPVTGRRQLAALVETARTPA
ncbi:helix-turn-helix transcriptional regulator [Tersicoccus solisilvae]|uniref:helix-turn-helix transcriptional regulator n=1 Tax=Tersicoccus solisilvae TaxID=1882339 RepID=UPI001662EEED|nr:LuxR family transcriptional regulator [Tersicoccus solisilvae]